MHFLHLEDSEADAELIHELLLSKWPQTRITTLGSRSDFEQAVNQKDFDLVLSDYSLPGYDGLSALKFVRQNCPDTPFIYISGTIGEERAIEALKAGANDYVIKDRPARLIHAIDSALSHAEQERSKRMASEKIREQASLLDKAHEAIAVIDIDGRVTYWNARAERFYGWPVEQAIGREIRELLYRDDQTRFDAACKAVATHGEWNGELQPHRRNGETLVVESFWNRVTDEAGLAKSILMIDVDITERKCLEARMREAQRLETLGMLAGGIAHDLNNVLAPILTSVGALSARASHSTDRSMLAAVEVSAQHGADLVRQLLAFARGSKAQRDTITIDGLLGSIQRLLQPAMPTNIELRVAPDDGLWTVHADATQLRQVLLNLCINARDAMPDGGYLIISAENVEIETPPPCVQGDARPGRYVRLSVADTGTGIPKEIIAKIFDPFFTTKSAGKGTGLGLMNVAEIVKAHGGFLDLESEPGSGTVFRLHLPAQECASPVSAKPESSQPPRQGHGEHILVVEDDEGIRTVLEIILSTRGYRVTLAADGSEGIELVREHPREFALVMTDMNMPTTSGLEVVQALEKIPDPPKVIVLSGLPGEAEEPCPELANVTRLNKPISTEGLLRSVREVLDR